MTTYIESLSRFVPELITCFAMIVAIFLEIYTKNKKIVVGSSIILLVTVLISLGIDFSYGSARIFSGSMVIDSFSVVLKAFVVFGTIAVLYLGLISSSIYEKLKGEFVILSLGVLIGSMLLISANNMLMAYIGIETMSLLSYALATFGRNNERSVEAGLKYLLYGAVASGIMLFGMSHLYGMFGSVEFTVISKAILTLERSQSYLFLPMMMFFFVGIGYKVATVPFHMWAPDVFEGSPTPATMIFALIPKIAGIALLIRVSLMFFDINNLMIHFGWVSFIGLLAVLTMTVGNVTAIGQSSVKRMLAFSSISHIGVILLGLVVSDRDGIDAMLFYLLAYLFMVLTAFYVVSIVDSKYGNDDFDRFSGLIKKEPFVAVIMCVVMFSFAGLPPFSGFVAKFNILRVLIAKNYYMLSIILVINSVISLYYYLKLVRYITLNNQEDEESISEFNYLSRIVIFILFIPVVALGIWWEQAIGVIENAKILLQ